MSDSEKPIIWLIDDNEHELRTHRNRLAEMLTDQVDVRPLQPFKTLGENVTLLDDPLTACVVVDERLKETGTASYTGIELAGFLRAINPKLPIYILTNFADEEDEFAQGKWSVEDILAKTDMTDANKRQVASARILRRIDVYRDILTKREYRLRDLLSKSLDADLDSAEQKELRELQLQRSAPALAIELGQLEQLTKVIEAHKTLMETIDAAARTQGHAQ